MLFSKVKDQFLQEFGKFEDDEMMISVQSLFKPSHEISMDNKYQILDRIKTLIMIPDPESIKNSDPLTSSNWRLMVLLNFVASQDVETNHRLLDHLLGDFEDLMYTNSFVNNELAKISLKVLKKNLSDYLSFIHKTGMILH